MPRVRKRGSKGYKSQGTRPKQKKDLVYELTLQGYPRAAIIKMTGISTGHFDRTARKLRKESPEFKKAFYKAKERIALSERVLLEAHKTNAIFNGLMAGKSIKEIAQELGMQPIRLARHVKRLAESMGREKAKTIQKALDEYSKELEEFRQKMPSKKTLDRVFARTEVWAERAPTKSIKERLKELEELISKTMDSGKRNKLVMERNALRSVLKHRMRE